MPNKVSHTFYYMNFKKILRDNKNKDPENTNEASIPSDVGEALEESLSELDML